MPTSLAFVPAAGDADGNQQDAGFDNILNYLQHCNGFDFTGYKPGILARRLRVRMAEHGICSFPAYLEYLKRHPAEFTPLFDTILIRVTQFFRDEPQWTFLQESIVPKIVNAKGAEQPIRAWVPGCSSGEEAYTMAMILAEALGPEMFKSQVTIFATDIDPSALVRARKGRYTARQMLGVPLRCKKKYFHSISETFEVRHDLRDAIVFSRHDLIHDPWFSRLDLISCHNTLMYLNLETQREVLRRFHRALNVGGYVSLGKNDGAAAAGEFFTPANRLFGLWQKG